MATGQLLCDLPCSWNGYALGLSLPIPKSRKNAFVKKNRTWCYRIILSVPYKGVIHGLLI